MPDKDDVTQFWRNIWDYPKEHNHNAQWIQNAQKELGRNTMEDIVITEEMVKKQAKKMKNWTAPRKDEKHGFWIKHLTSLHPRIAQQLNRPLETAIIEEWLSTGKTILLMKNKKAGAIPSNYRPITCLCTTFNHDSNHSRCNPEPPVQV